VSRTPSLPSLRLFMQVAHSLSFSETARTANLSQPALSRTIRLLEEDLGVRLFDRNSRNVRLTTAGAALLPTVERLTGDFDLAFRELKQTFEGQRGRVVVGALPTFAAHLLPGVLGRFRRSHPQVEIILRENLTSGLYHSLRDRLIDFAIAIAPPVADDTIHFQPLLHDECVLVCHPDDAPQIPDPAPWSLFRDRPFIGMDKSSSVRMLTDVAFARAGIVTPALYECVQLATVGGLIVAGLGISLLPRSTLPMLASAGTLATRAMQAPHAMREIGIARLAGRTPLPAAQALITEVIAAARQAS
jgi:LysR family transcriptional regulator, carnitine catabolism transcriptional activator